MVTEEASHHHGSTEGEAVEEAHREGHQGQEQRPLAQQQGPHGGPGHDAVVLQGEADGHTPVVRHREQRPRLHSQKEQDKEHVTQTSLVPDVSPLQQERVQQLGDERGAAAQIRHRQVEHDHVSGRVEALHQAHHGQEEAVPQDREDVHEAQEHEVILHVREVGEATEVEPRRTNNRGIEQGSSFLL